MIVRVGRVVRMVRVGAVAVHQVRVLGVCVEEVLGVRPRIGRVRCRASARARMRPEMAAPADGDCEPAAAVPSVSVWNIALSIISTSTSVVQTTEELRAEIQNVSTAAVLSLQLVPGRQYLLDGTQLHIPAGAVVHLTSMEDCATIDGEERSRLFFVHEQAELHVIRVNLINGRISAEGGAVLDVAAEHASRVRQLRRELVE